MPCVDTRQRIGSDASEWPQPADFIWPQLTTDGGERESDLGPTRGGRPPRSKVEC